MTGTHSDTDGRTCSRTAVVLSQVVLATLVLMGVGSCRQRDQAEQRYQLKGKVVNVDKRGGVVTVAHEAIAGYMDSMVMPFSLKDPSLLDQMLDGDSLQATLVISGKRSWLEDVVVMRETIDASNINSARSNAPRPGDEVPDFTLINQDGRKINLRNYRGRAVALTFIYTRCPLPDYCPLMTEQFAEIEQTLAKEPELYAKSQLLSVTVDPDFDTPKVLRGYALQTAGAQALAHWEFATGSTEQVRQVATYFGMTYFKETDQIVHSLRTAVIGPDGKLVDLWNGNQWKPKDLLRELRSAVMQDRAQASSEPDPTAEEEKAFHGIGTVEKLDNNAGTILLNHEDIEGLMPAMSMTFKVKDKAMLDSIAPGDRVRFDITADLVVIWIKKI